MNEQLNTSEIVEGTDQYMNNPAVYSDPFAEKIPVDTALINETPIDETVAVGTPLNETIVHEVPLGETTTKESTIDQNAGSSTALFNREESEHFRTRWNEIQGKFVDEPRAAVKQADTLVSEVVEQITQMFAHEHSSLEGQWNQGNDVSTEDLRKALQRYRSFFNRLVV